MRLLEGRVGAQGTTESSLPPVLGLIKGNAVAALSPPAFFTLVWQRLLRLFLPLRADFSPRSTAGVAFNFL